VDPPLPEGLAIGVFWAQYRVEHLRIVNVFGANAVDVSPRIGHLHVIVDDLPWWWADASDNNTVDIAGLPPGPHKVRIQLVDPHHNVFPGQYVTLSFIVPDYEGAKAHSHAAPANRLAEVSAHLALRRFGPLQEITPCQQTPATCSCFRISRTPVGREGSPTTISTRCAPWPVD
jgi:hypothetical protein